MKTLHEINGIAAVTSLYLTGKCSIKQKVSVNMECGTVTVSEGLIKRNKPISLTAHLYLGCCDMPGDN